MATELMINASLPETRIALMENGEIQELLIERASGKGIVGNVYKGRVTRVLPGMQAAFVDIGLEKAAFLYVDDVYVHSEIWAEEEGTSSEMSEGQESDRNVHSESSHSGSHSVVVAPPRAEGAAGSSHSEAPASQEAQLALNLSDEPSASAHLAPGADQQDLDSSSVHRDLDSDYSQQTDDDTDDKSRDENDESDDDDRRDPVSMARAPKGGSGGSSSDAGEDAIGNRADPPGTIAPSREPADAPAQDDIGNRAAASEVKSEAHSSGSQPDTLDASGDSSGEAPQEGAPGPDGEGESEASAEGATGEDSQKRQGRHRRGRRGGRFRRRRGGEEAPGAVQEPRVRVPKSAQAPSGDDATYPESYREQIADAGDSDSDRSGMTEDAKILQGESSAVEGDNALIGRPEIQENRSQSPVRVEVKADHRADFKAPRSRDRRIRVKQSTRAVRAQVNIQDLLKEGQEIIVQVAKDPIATKGARLTCHISLPGRHLVCMPTIDHVGVSRRIERDEERRRLREYVERHRPKNLGFIVRTASGKQQSEKRIKQDIEYLTHLWSEIRENSTSAAAPALVYEDLNSVLRAVRDWVNEDIDKVVVDSRYHFNEILKFASHFMPSLKQKVELYHGDIPLFDAYGISTELSRSLERKVWLKSGGYIVIDQAEALVAIDVNTGRYVGKKNLEDTILKTNLEAVEEIAYQLRLRNCGGIIILDLIDMEREDNKHRVYRALEEALARDRARPTIMKISDLGLIEMTRKRTRDTIVRTLCESCTHCEGKGFIKSKQTVAYEVMREIEREGIERDIGKILVQAHPDVIDILAIDERETLDQLEKRYRKQIYLQAVMDFHPEQFEVTADKKDKVEKGHSERSHERSHERSNEKSHDSGGDRHRNRNRGGGHSNQKSSQPQASQVPAEPLARVVIRPKVESAEKVQGAPTDLSAQDLPAAEANGEGPAPAPRAQVKVSVRASAIAQNGGEQQSGQGQSGEGDQEAEEGNSYSGGEDSAYDEEDRLAFLRAQAAQDAALARLGTGGGVAHSTLSKPAGKEGARGDRGGAPGNNRRNPRNRRGGKFRRNDRGRNAGPKPFSYGKAPSGRPSGSGPSGLGVSGPTYSTQSGYETRDYYNSEPAMAMPGNSDNSGE